MLPGPLQGVRKDRCAHSHRLWGGPHQAAGAFVPRLSPSLRPTAGFRVSLAGPRVLGPLPSPLLPTDVGQHLQVRASHTLKTLHPLEHANTVEDRKSKSPHRPRTTSQVAGLPMRSHRVPAGPPLPKQGPSDGGLAAPREALGPSGHCLPGTGLQQGHLHCASAGGVRSQAPA